MLSFRALHQFKSSHSRLPSPGSVHDANDFFEIVVSNNEAAKNAMSESAVFQLPESELRENEQFFKRFALCCAGIISPVCSVIGGVVGQEVLKACSGKFMPIIQWHYFDAVETLPSERLSEQEVAPRGCRYDGQIAVYGSSLQKKLHSLNCFLVGAGAIGCEILKIWALMGVSCSCNYDNTSQRTGVSFVTDMDQIERSNLSRQFLFRNSNIGQLKSVTAANASRMMNNAFNTVAYESKVSSETESFFNDDFFEKLDIVCAALDNVEARLYLDQRCVFYHKPMLESGTLGAKGNTTVVVPGLSTHYGASRDPPEKSIPMCTVKSFPNQIEHTLQWAREWFEETFKQTPSDVNNYLSNPHFVAEIATQQNTKLETVARVKNALVTQLPRSFDDCISFARLCFEDLFVNKIKQLLFVCPLDKVTSEGNLFWYGRDLFVALVDFVRLIF
jgi:ubiquitin-activating enzyme E1